MTENKIYVFEDEKRIPEVIELFRLGLGDTTEQHWQWRLFRCDFTPKPEAFVMENESGKMVGMGTVLPVEYGDAEYKCVQMCDWVVHPDYRGQGIIGKLYDFIYRRYEEKGYDFLIEFPNENSYPIFKKYGFEEHSSPVCWNTKQRLFFSFKKKCSADINIEIDDFTYRVTNACPITQPFPQKKGRISRTPQFLRWKYDFNPDSDFQWLGIWRDSVLCGYLVFTQTRGRIRTVVNVYDFDYWLSDSAPFSTAIELLESYGNYVSIWGKFDADGEKLFTAADMHKTDAGNKLVLKAMSKKGYPSQLQLTRIDTDF